MDLDYLRHTNEIQETSLRATGGLISAQPLPLSISHSRNSRNGVHVVLSVWCVAYACIKVPNGGYFSSEYERGWVLVGTIVIVAFLVDELKIEFLRYTTVDYGHFVFALFGIFLGWSDAARANAQAAAMRSKSQDTASSVLRDLPPVMAGRSRVK